ncbi:MAG: hypothetical protein A2Y77_13600 [Planctomycetes bacterium RBG_13_62_9]|nr:MAG: hypothetical protein A2Y77_13600 [Planctomycetes bacterium RBG_13_62_9]
MPVTDQRLGAMAEAGDSLFLRPVQEAGKGFYKNMGQIDLLPAKLTSSCTIGRFVIRILTPLFLNRRLSHA